jgi:hypothetical protein
VCGLAQHVPVLLGVLYHLGPGRRFGAEAPRRQRGAGGACPRGQGPLPAAQCPAPTAAWVTTGAAADTHPRVPAGLIPSMARRTSSSCNRALLLSRAILALSPRRPGCAKLPGCRHRDAAARRGRGAPVLRSGAGGGREARASKGQAERRVSSPRRRPPSWKKSWPGRASPPSPDPTAVQLLVAAPVTTACGLGIIPGQPMLCG